MQDLLWIAVDLHIGNTGGGDFIQHQLADGNIFSQQAMELAPVGIPTCVPVLDPTQSKPIRMYFATHEIVSLRAFLFAQHHGNMR